MRLGHWVGWGDVGEGDVWMGDVGVGDVSPWHWGSGKMKRNYKDLSRMENHSSNLLELITKGRSIDIERHAVEYLLEFFNWMDGCRHRLEYVLEFSSLYNWWWKNQRLVTRILQLDRLIETTPRVFSRFLQLD